MQNSKFACCLCNYESWCFTLREYHMLRAFENMVLGLKCNEAGENWRMRTVMICTAQRISFGWWSQGQWSGMIMVKNVGGWGGANGNTHNFCGELAGKRPLGGHIRWFKSLRTWRKWSVYICIVLFMCAIMFIAHTDASVPLTANSL
jgi:hypothetical protein